MYKFRAFENERETEVGRKTDYDMVTVMHVRARKDAEINAARSSLGVTVPGPEVRLATSSTSQHAWAMAPGPGMSPTMTGS